MNERLKAELARVLAKLPEGINEITVRGVFEGTPYQIDITEEGLWYAVDLNPLVDKMGL